MDVAGLGRVPGVRAAYRALTRSRSWVRTRREFEQFRQQAIKVRPAFVPEWRERLFMLDNRTGQTPFDRHYVYHTGWALRQLIAQRPSEHVDVSSSVYFVALGSAAVPMRHFDFRPLPLELSNLECRRGDVTALPLETDSVRSLSCMHVIEHIGLGRYGDAIDALGDVKAAAELTRVLAPGGRLYMVMPVGRRRVCFNGHRVYDHASVRELFPGLEMVENALVPDDDHVGMIVNASAALIDAQEYGCGCFAFVKPARG
jgi:hypothetical protein